MVFGCILSRRGCHAMAGSRHRLVGPQPSARGIAFPPPSSHGRCCHPQWAYHQLAIGPCAPVRCVPHPLPPPLSRRERGPRLAWPRRVPAAASLCHLLWLQAMVIDRAFALSLSARARSVVREAPLEAVAAAAARRPAASSSVHPVRVRLGHAAWAPFVVAVHPESDAPSVRRVIALRSLESALALGAAVEGVVVLLRREGSLPHRRFPGAHDCSRWLRPHSVIWMWCGRPRRLEAAVTSALLAECGRVAVLPPLDPAIGRPHCQSLGASLRGAGAAGSLVGHLHGGAPPA